MSRFFIDPEHISDTTLEITGEDVLHIKKVLRMHVGDTITVCDGNERDYFVRIAEMGTENIKCEILKSKKSANEPPVKIILFQGIPKADKFEYIIQKNTELGVDEIVPMLTERTVVKLNTKKDIEKKLTRWRKIAYEAAKQCNRGKIPKVSEPILFEKALTMVNHENIGIIAYENQEKNPQNVGLLNKTFSVFIGPEGGFSLDEVDMAINHGITPVSLGPRILRTETAGLVLVSILMNKFGDIKPLG